MIEPDDRDLEVPEADEIEQRTLVVAADDEPTEDVRAALPDEAAEADALEQNVSVDDEDEYPPT